MKSSKNIFGLETFALVAGSALALLSNTGRAQQAPPPTPVTIAPVEQKEIVEWSEFTGHTEPVQSVEIRPRVSGYIDNVKFQSGQLVKKGDVLFEIDPRWNQAIYDQRKAEYDKAKSEADRKDGLLKSNAISTEEAESREAGYEGAKAALESARLDLEYTKVRSPIDGRVSRALLTEGNYVSGNAGGASLLTTVVSVDPIYVTADVDEASLLKFNGLVATKKLGVTDEGKIPVELQLGDESNFPYTGTIESFDNQLNAGTGSILLRSIFTNADGSIVPGLFARIRIPMSDKHPALLIEERAVGTDQANKFVLTLTSSNTVAYRPVELGPLVDGKRIVRSGLAAGEKVVVNGLARVRPGSPVAPQTEAEAAQAAQQTAQR
jgi:RND family efflux transporter MFP subunit